MNDDDRQQNDGKDKKAPPLQNTTAVSWRGRTPASKADEDPHGDYAFGKTNVAHDDEGVDVRDVKTEPEQVKPGSEVEARSRLLGEGQERGESDDEDDVRQSS